MPVSQITNPQKVLTPRSTRAFTSDMLDFEVLKAIEKVKSDDGSDILIELIEFYLQGASQRIIAMHKAADEGEWTVLKRAAHTLKGSSSTIYIRQYAMFCQYLESSTLNTSNISPIYTD